MSSEYAFSCFMPNILHLGAKVLGHSVDCELKLKEYIETVKQL